MIATSTEYWKSFLDPNSLNHKKAQDNMKFYDKEKIVINEIVISEIINWLYENKKYLLIEWFFDYVSNTANVRIFHFGKEEFRLISKICLEKQINFSDGSLQYLAQYLNCDITKEF